MEEKIFRINVELGNNYSASFNAVRNHADEENTSYARVDSDGIISNGGVLSIDSENGKIALLYDIFSVVTCVRTEEEVDGNFFYICSNNLFDEIKIYIVEYDIWCKEGKSIFKNQ